MPTSTEESNAAAVVVMKGIDHVRTRVTTVDRMICGRNENTAKVIADPQWHVEVYLERWGERLDLLRYPEMTVNGPSPYSYDLRRARHDSCVEA